MERRETEREASDYYENFSTNVGKLSSSKKAKKASNKNIESITEKVTYTENPIDLSGPIKLHTRSPNDPMNYK